MTLTQLGECAVRIDASRSRSRPVIQLMSSGLFSPEASDATGFGRDPALLETPSAVSEQVGARDRPRQRGCLPWKEPRTGDPPRGSQDPTFRGKGSKPRF